MRQISFIALTCIAISFALPHGAQAQDHAAGLSAPRKVPGTLISGPPGRSILSTSLMAAGGALVGIGWAANALGGYGAGWTCAGGSGGGSLGSYYGGGGGCQHPEEWGTFRDLSLVPVVGPWAQLMALPEDARGDGNGWTGWLIASGIIQTTGVLMLLVGMGMKLVDLSASDDDAIVLTPSVSPGEAGLSVSGRF